MPNFLSVANRATVRDPYLNISEENKKEPLKGFRLAGQVLKGNFVGSILTDLIFPDPVADGTLKGAIKRNGGYIGTGVDP